MFDTICIIGCGLIGSSIARAVRLHGLSPRIVCADADADVCAQARRLGLANEVTQDLASGVEQADLVFLCVPVGAYDTVMSSISGSLKAGAIISDVGSVKQKSMTSVIPHLPENVNFVPGHPVAGTEHSGPAAGFAELFVNRWCILTPGPDTDIRAVEKVTEFWEACGSKIEIMDAKHHDLVLATTSHLPHLIAYTIVGTATDLEEHMQSEIVKFSASGFRDFTRIAASDPVMWRDIFLGNKEAVIEVLQRFSEDLTALQRAIRWQDGEFLENFFTRTRNIRRQIIEAGQVEYVYPAGGGAILSQEGTPPSGDQCKESGS